MRTRKLVVYFVGAPGRIKVGVTADIERRLATLQAVDMEPLTLLATVDGAHALERETHRRIADYRIKGEWFRDCHEVRGVMQTVIEKGKRAFPFAASRMRPEDFFDPKGEWDRLFGRLSAILDANFPPGFSPPKTDADRARLLRVAEISTTVAGLCKQSRDFSYLTHLASARALVEQAERLYAH